MALHQHTQSAFKARIRELEEEISRVQFDLNTSCQAAHQDFNPDNCTMDITRGDEPNHNKHYKVKMPKKYKTGDDIEIYLQRFQDYIHLMGIPDTDSIA